MKRDGFREKAGVECDPVFFILSAGMFKWSEILWGSGSGVRSFIL